MCGMKKIGESFILVIIAIVLIVLIMGQTSSMLQKLTEIKGSRDDLDAVDDKVDIATTVSDKAPATVITDEEVTHETEHGENKIKYTIYDSFLSPKKILSYRLPFLTALDVGKQSSVDKSIFTKLSKPEIKTKTTDDGQLMKVSLKGDGPHFLIYHTHTTEAFRMKEEGQYQETTPWRTNDKNYSIVGIGEKLANLLENEYGYSVLHDTTNHEPPKLSTAYSRSVLTMENYVSEYDDLNIFIDVHRDAANIETDTDDVVIVDGKRCARVMFVVGTGVNFSKKPEWETNYKIALSLNNELNKMSEGFAKPIRVKDGRYNQHISNACILIEVGHNANTYAEAANSVSYIARAIDAIIEK